MKPIEKIISLFDGISCAYEAAKKAGCTIKEYYASEIDKYAIEISKKNHPDIIHVGDVSKLTIDPYAFNFTGGLDLLVGGSPCQDLSIAKANRKGLDGDRSGLFFEYVRILNETKPRYFILENVASMPKADMEKISEILGVQPIMINAALVSAQNRKRLFWVGKYQKVGKVPKIGEDGYVDVYGYRQVDIKLPDDQGIVLNDILIDGDTDDVKSLCITATYASKNRQDYEKKRMGQMIRIGDIGSNAQAHRVYSPNGKSVALSALGGGQGAKTGLYLVQKPHGFNKGGEHHEKSPTLTKSSFEQNNHVTDGYMLRKLHPIECERLQGLPDNYTEGVSNTQRYKMCGNAFNVDVVAHIISQLVCIVGETPLTPSLNLCEQHAIQSLNKK